MNNEITDLSISTSNLQKSDNHEEGTINLEINNVSLIKSNIIIDSEQSTYEMKQEKKPSNICYLCNRKLGLIPFTCKCGNNYCARHRHSFDHNCTFDYIGEAREKIRKENPPVVGTKINKI